jgi:hypothetical protein
MPGIVFLLLLCPEYYLKNYNGRVKSYLKQSDIHTAVSSPAVPLHYRSLLQSDAARQVIYKYECTAS